MGQRLSAIKPRHVKTFLLNEHMQCCWKCNYINPSY